MSKYMRCIITLFLFAPLTIQAGPKLVKLAEKNPGKTLAVVSLSANNFANSLQGWNNVSTTDLMVSRMNKMLKETEKLFSQDWKLIPASTFVEKAEYQSLAGEQRDVGVPKKGKYPMPLFSKDRKQMIKTRVDKEVAIALAKVTGADFIAIIYSEWGVVTGKFVPTSKALTKNVVGIYNSQGKQVYFDRHDQAGKKKLGMMGKVVVDENSINEWVNAYKSAITTLFNKGRKKK